VLSFLHDAGNLDGVDVSDPVMVGALRSAVTLADRYAHEVGATPGSLTLAMTNGRQLYALRRGSPLCMVQRDRLQQRESMHAPAAKPTAPQAVRYVIVASHAGPSTPPSYSAVADGSVVCVDRDLRVTQHALAN
jgi:hypothetical protein